MKKEYKGYTIRIEQDENENSPEEWGNNDLFLVANHKDFFVKSPVDGINLETPIAEMEKEWWIMGLEAYIHSGVVLALSREGNFPDRQWDVSQLGAVFASKKEWKTKQEARKAALGLSFRLGTAVA